MVDFVGELCSLFAENKVILSKEILQYIEDNNITLSTLKSIISSGNILEELKRLFESDMFTKCKVQSLKSEVLKFNKSVIRISFNLPDEEADIKISTLERIEGFEVKSINGNLILVSHINIKKLRGGNKTLEEVYEYILCNRTLDGETYITKTNLVFILYGLIPTQIYKNILCINILNPKVYTLTLEDNKLK